MDRVLSASFCHSSGHCSGAKRLRADQQLARNGSTEMADRAEREELNGRKKEWSQVKTNSDQSSILLFQHAVMREGKGGAIPAK
jgi:hypothetical protein